MMKKYFPPCLKTLPIKCLKPCTTRHSVPVMVHWVSKTLPIKGLEVGNPASLGTLHAHQLEFYRTHTLDGTKCLTLLRIRAQGKYNT